MRLIILISILFQASISFSQAKEKAIKDAKDSLYHMNQDAAIQILNDYLKIDSLDAEVYYELGEIKKATSVVNGFEEFNKALSLDSLYVKALTSRALYYFFKEELDLSLQDYQKAYQLAPDMDILRDIANVKINKGEYTEAIEILTNLIQSENDEIAKGLRAHAYFLMREYSKAISDYTSFPLGALPMGYWELAKSYYCLGRQREACETIQYFESFWNCQDVDENDYYCVETKRIHSLCCEK